MAKKVVKEIKYRCRDCKHSFDWHEKAYDTGEPFLCRCKYYTNGKYCKFLNDYQCNQFELRTK